MKVLIEVPPQPRHFSVALGWKNAFESAGHAVTLWERSAVSDFDAFDTTLPGLFVSMGGRPVLARVLFEHHKTRVYDASGDLPAFDRVRFPQKGKFRKELSCDVCYVGGYRKEKRDLIDGAVSPLIQDGLKVKLFGPNRMPYAQYLGPISDRGLADLCVSAKVCLNLSLGRLSERAYQAVGLGGLLVSNTAPNGEIYEPEHTACTAANAAKFTEAQRNIAFSAIETIWDANGNRPGRAPVLSQTYHDRVANAFQHLGFATEAKGVIDALDRL